MKTTLDSFSTPEELYLWMHRKLEYAYHTKSGKKSTDFEKMDDLYVLQTPEQVLENKYGVCWDDAFLEKEWLNKNNFENILLYISLDLKVMKTTHTFIIYKRLDNIWYYMEHAFTALEQHRPITNFKSVIDMIILSMVADKAKTNKDVELVENNIYMTKVKDMGIPYGQGTRDVISFLEQGPNIYKNYIKLI